MCIPPAGSQRRGRVMTAGLPRRGRWEKLHDQPSRVFLLFAPCHQVTCPAETTPAEHCSAAKKIHPETLHLTLLGPGTVPQSATTLSCRPSPAQHAVCLVDDHSSAHSSRLNESVELF
jgi:hypothetical protein